MSGPNTFVVNTDEYTGYVSSDNIDASTELICEAIDNTGGDVIVDVEANYGYEEQSTDYTDADGWPG